jgi:hypothetical protein
VPDFDDAESLNCGWLDNGISLDGEKSEIYEQWWWEGADTKEGTFDDYSSETGLCSPRRLGASAGSQDPPLQMT